jgi:hypothetical protein
MSRKKQQGEAGESQAVATEETPIVPPTPTVRPQVETPNPGLYFDVDFDTYTWWAGVSHGVLANFRKTPLHVRYELDHGGKARTPALELGWLLHLATLEPERFDASIAVAIKVDRRTTEGKRAWAEFEAANAGKQLVPSDDYESVMAMRNALYAHPTAGEFLRSPGKQEVSVLWEDRETGVRCKGRIDKIGQIGEWVVVGDIKTAQDASRRAFEGSLYRFGYNLQAVHYLAGLEALIPPPSGSGVDQPFRRFLFFVVESAPPWAVAVYEMDDVSLAQSEQDRQRYLRRWKKCKETGVWPGYPDGAELVSLPAWAMRAYAIEDSD